MVDSNNSTRDYSEKNGHQGVEAGAYWQGQTEESGDGTTLETVLCPFTR